MDASAIVEDIPRALVVAGCLLLAVLSLRIAWVRRRTRKESGATHLATTLSYAGLLLLTAGRRVERAGEPLDAWFVGAALCVAFGMWGALDRARLPVHPPWRGAERRERSHDHGDPRP